MKAFNAITVCLIMFIGVPAVCHASSKAISIKGAGVNIAFLNNCGISDKWTPQFDSINARLIDPAEAKENKDKFEWYKNEFVKSAKADCGNPSKTIGDVEKALEQYRSFVDSYNRTHGVNTTRGLGSIPANPVPPPPGSIENTVPGNPMSGLTNGVSGSKDVNVAVPGIGNINFKTPSIDIGGFFGESTKTASTSSSSSSNYNPSGKAHYVLGVSKKISGVPNIDKIHPGWANVYEESGLYAGMLSKCEGRGVSWRNDLLSDTSSRAGTDASNKLITAYDQNFRYAADGDMPCSDFHMPTLIKKGDLYVSQMKAYKRS